jgi:hypothetical protein
MSSKAEEYRAKADDCDKQAEQAKDPETRRQFLELARQWRVMATAAALQGK